MLFINYLETEITLFEKQLEKQGLSEQYLLQKKSVTEDNYKTIGIPIFMKYHSYESPFY